MDYQIQLPVFEGPFDLLLHLIRVNQVDICDIPIAEITQQYLDYLQQMQEMDLEIASSFLVMAATLLSIKAKILLPAPPGEESEEEDARSELVHELLEYVCFKEAAQQMQQMHELSERRILRPNEQELYLNLFSEENPLNGKTLADLRSAFVKVLQRAEAQPEPVLQIEREQVTLPDRLRHLRALLKRYRQGFSFERAFDDCCSRTAMVVTFMALLELIRRKTAVAAQVGSYGDIFILPGEVSGDGGDDGAADDTDRADE